MSQITWRSHAANTKIQKTYYRGQSSNSASITFKTWQSKLDPIIADKEEIII